MKILLFALTGLILMGSLNSCVSYKDLISYQESPTDTTIVKAISPPEIRVQKNDILSIKVFGTDMETVAPFNKSTGNDLYSSPESLRLSGYLVDKKGEIDFPVLGSVKLAGMTTWEAKEHLKELLDEFLTQADVSLRLLNFKITVSGEVRNPGAYNVLDERISVSDALAMAGGLSDYANSSNILIVREEDGIMKRDRINLKNADVFESKYYYLKQNDLLYVEPLRSKVGAITDQTNKIIPIISTLATLVTIVVALRR